MTMTRQHFELIARVMNKNITDARNNDQKIVTASPVELFEAQAKQWADVLKNTNPNFDKAKFLVACGLEA